MDICETILGNNNGARPAFGGEKLYAAAVRGLIMAGRENKETKKKMNERICADLFGDKCDESPRANRCGSL